MSCDFSRVPALLMTQGAFDTCYGRKSYFPRIILKVSAAASSGLAVEVLNVL